MLLFQRRWVRFLLLGFVLSVSAFVIPALLITRDRRPPSIREFSRIREEWERTVYGHALEGGPLTMLADWNAKSLTKEEKEQKIESLANRCLKHAEKYPDTTGELAALYLATARGAATEAGVKSREQLVARIATADFAQLQHAIPISRAGDLKTIIPAILDRVKHDPENLKAGAMLSYVCSTLAAGPGAKDAPPHFAEAADLLAAHCADSPDIYNFCEVLGNGFESPHWSGQFESHVRTILEVNQDRWVRCTASMALASIAQSYVERQQEAEKLYKNFLKEFDGHTEYSAQALEREYRRRAEMQLTAMKFNPIGRVAPEIVGSDLDGKPMTLSEYRGKVVLLSFWATWCAPCMKLIPHERELAVRLADQPFTVVGVNGDQDYDRINKALTSHEIIWRSFNDKRDGAKSISDEWNALYPTVYLIDQHGIIRHRFTGAPDPVILKQIVDDLVEAAKVE